MKTLVEQELNKMGIRTRDDDGNLRSPDDLTEDAMALLEQCDEEKTAQILFTIPMAKSITDAAQQIEERRV